MRKSTENIFVACEVSREENRVALQKPKPDPEQIIALFFTLLKNIASEDKKTESTTKQQ